MSPLDFVFVISVYFLTVRVFRLTADVNIYVKKSEILSCLQNYSFGGMRHTWQYWTLLQFMNGGWHLWQIIIATFLSTFFFGESIFLKRKKFTSCLMKTLHVMVPETIPSRELFGPEKRVVKLQSVSFKKLIFKHSFNVRKTERIFCSLMAENLGAAKM